MSKAIIVAIVAFVSTILGATIGAATTYVLAVRRERADKERDSLNHFIEVKRAARLIDAEFSRAEAAARICVEERYWWSADARKLSTETWQKYNATIAADLSDEAWLAVRISAESVVDLRTARDLATAAGLDAHAISDSTAEELARMLRDVQLGRAALAPFMSSSLKRRP